jgi:hypothetical protein
MVGAISSVQELSVPHSSDYQKLFGYSSCSLNKIHFLFLLVDFRLLFYSVIEKLIIPNSGAIRHKSHVPMRIKMLLLESYNVKEKQRISHLLDII